jgi:hypothetical protein
MRRKSTTKMLEADLKTKMLEADLKRVGAAKAVVDKAWRAALAGCPGDMKCGEWLERHAETMLAAAYDSARCQQALAEETAIARGTLYRGTFGLLFPVRWR